jgi:release factor glutamine methyltransferase
MNIGQFLVQSSKYLSDNGILTARLDCLILIEFVTGINRAKILAQPEIVLTHKQKNVLDKLIAKRSKHIPIAHMTNNIEFYGRNFYVNKDVLIPRPESESIIDLLINLFKTETHLINKMLSSTQTESNSLVRIGDIGTGSGALGITAKLELKNIKVDLIDIDKKALKVAQINVDLYTIDANLIQSDLLGDNVVNYDILLANLPYVPDEYEINNAAKHEPSISIFGGKDGLDFYLRLFDMLSKTLQHPLLILTEALPFQHIKIESVALKSGYKFYQSKGLAQVFIRSE